MSDDEFMMDAEDYGFEYESEDEDQPDVNLENQYYNAKGTAAWLVFPLNLIVRVSLEGG